MSKLSIGAIAVAIALAFSAGALAAQPMSKDAYQAGKDKIAAEYKSAQTACNALAANAKDICMAEAKGQRKVAKAELEASNKPSDKTRKAVSVAKAEAAYAVAKEKCDDKAANARAACVKEAKAAETRAKQKSATSTSKTESVGEYADDAVITAKVKAAVLNEPTLNSAEINVETSKGRVQLSGFVSSRADIDRAVKVAKGVEGVTSVKNDMILKGTQ